MSKQKQPTAFQIERTRKNQAKLMSRSNAAFKLMNLRAVHTFTLERFRQHVRETLGKPCRFCEKKITPKNFSPDHRIPLGRGGTATLSNIDIICLPCNHRKGDLSKYEYVALLGFLETLGPEAKKSVLRSLALGAAAKGRFSRWFARK